MRDALVIVRAGQDSFHRGWLAADRPFDLWELRHGPIPPGPADRTFHADGPKWGPLADLIDDQWHRVRRYEIVSLPDDDLEASPATWAKLLEEGEALGFDLFAPSMSAAGYPNWPWLLRRPDLRARVVRCVEIMAPCFTRDALVKARPTFRANVSGWGIEALWAGLGLRTGVIDSVEFVHTRPNGNGDGIAPLYARLGVDPGKESLDIIARCGFHPSEEKLYEEILP